MIYHVIALATKNVIHVLMSNFYEDFFNHFGCLYYEKQENVQRSEKFHEEIYMAIKNQNAGEAKRIIEEVLLCAEQEIYKELGQS